MPIYEYTCPSCSCHFELLRSFSENGTVSCPECGCDAQRIFSPVPVIFKGSGFYVTDHRDNHGKPQSTINKSEPESDKSESTSSNDEVKTTTPEENS